MRLKNKTFFILYFWFVFGVLFSKVWAQETSDRQFISSFIVRDLKTGKILVSRNSRQLMKPASLQKISSAYVALKTLSPQFRYETKLFQGPNHTYFYFSGDPTLTFEKLVQFFKKMRKQGVKSLKGDLYINQNLNPLYGHPSGWSIESTRFLYGAITNPINLNRNGLCFKIHPPKFYGNKASIKMDKNQPTYPVRNFLKVGQCTKMNALKRSDLSFNGKAVIARGCVSNGQGAIRACVPILPHQFQSYVVHAIQSALKQAGISFKGRVLFKTQPSPGKLLGVLSSDPLSVLLEEGMKDSRNDIMESLVFPLVERRYFTFQDETDMDQFLCRQLSHVNTDFKEARMLDMSGMSHHNLLSARMLESLLWSVYKSPEHFELWSQFLAISGKDGTLRGRFKRWPSSIHIKGKTGSLLSAQNVAGYIWHKNVPRFSFVMMVQNFTESPNKIQDFHEKTLKNILLPYLK